MDIPQLGPVAALLLKSRKSAACPETPSVTLMDSGLDSGLDYGLEWTVRMIEQSNNGLIRGGSSMEEWPGSDQKLDGWKAWKCKVSL